MYGIDFRIGRKRKFPEKRGIVLSEDILFKPTMRRFDSSSHTKSSSSQNGAARS